MLRRRSRPRGTLAIPLFLAVLAGCAQGGPLLSQRTTVGTLKASVSRLEYENQQMRSQIKGMQAESRRLEDRLVQEESLNGELSARLDDARDVLSRRGLGGPRDDSFDQANMEPPESRPRTLPAGRSTRPARKPPFARIPGQIDPVAPESGGFNAGDETSAAPGSGGRWLGEEPLRSGSARTDTRVWLPIAVGTSDPSAARR